jgi:transcriptional regulator with XRE-family HTH domain
MNLRARIAGLLRGAANLVHESWPPLNAESEADGADWFARQHPWSVEYRCRSSLTPFQEPFAIKGVDSIGGRLRATRAIRGWTQQDLADKAGIGLSTLKKYEADQSVPGGAALAGFARAGTNVNWLLQGDAGGSYTLEMSRLTGTESAGTARPNRQQLRNGLGKRLTKFRNALGLSQQEAALKFGVGRTTWIRYETKNREPKPAILFCLAKHGLNVAWLLNGDEAGPMTLEGGRQTRADHVAEVAARARQQFKDASKYMLDAYARLGQLEHRREILEGQIAELKRRLKT